MLEQKKIKEECLKRWGSSDEKIKIFKEKFEKWLDQMPMTL